MKKYSFIFIIFTLFVECAYADRFLVTAIQPGTGLTNPIPIDTIKPGVDFGILVGDISNPAAVGVGINFLTTKDSSGQWVPDVAGYFFPTNGNLGVVVPGIFLTDSAFYRTSWNVAAPQKKTWIRIVARDALTGEQDSSKPLLVMPMPIDSASRTITVTPNPMGAAGDAWIAIFAPEYGGVRQYEVKIFDVFGYLVRDLLPDVQHLNEQRYMFVMWDGKNGQGKKVANGVYQICVKVREAQEAGIWKKKIGVVW